MRAASSAACMLVCTGIAAALPLRAQTVSAWLDANAAHSRPPASTALDAASYGLLGARLRFDGIGSGLELSAATGRGASAEAGAWLNGRAAYEVSRIFGIVDLSFGAQGSGVTFLTPVSLAGGQEYSQSLLTAAVRPGVGISIAGTRLGAEAMYTRGNWRASVTEYFLPQPSPLPLPGPDAPQQHTTETEGAVEVRGGSLSLLRVTGPATFELRGSAYEAENQIASGRYAGIDAAVTLALGALDLMGGVRRWDSPARSVEIGAHGGLGISLGDAAYLQALVSRGVTDPVTGMAGDLAVSAGISVRLGRRSTAGPPPAAVGAATANGRSVRFTLKHDARTVEVAGDFSGWERRPLQRGADGVWTLETVLEPGVYHYSFVIDGETWMVPAGASGLVDDGFGRKNATIIVGSQESEG